MRGYFEQPVALERLVGMFRKNLKEIELACGERFLCAIRGVDEHALIKVQHPAAHAYTWASGRRCCSGRAPENALYARQQFARVKSFRNIVVCPCFYSHYAIHCIGGGSYHNDTDPRAPLAQPSRYREAILTWQTDIQQHECWTVTLHELPQVGAAGYPADSKILASQIIHQEVTLGRLVLDYDNVGEMRHSLPSPRR